MVVTASSKPVPLPMAPMKSATMVRTPELKSGGGRGGGGGGEEEGDRRQNHKTNTNESKHRHQSRLTDGHASEKGSGRNVLIQHPSSVVVRLQKKTQDEKYRIAALNEFVCTWFAPVARDPAINMPSACNFCTSSFTLLPLTLIHMYDRPPQERI
jgi:hypothetical protein